jgi:hypothetical protein
MKRAVFGLIVLLVFGFVFIGCDLTTGNDSPESPDTPDNTFTDYSFWFKEIYNDLLTRAIDEDTLIDMGQIANTQYVCNAINTKWGTTLTPVSGTETQAANCEYLLKTIDMANNNTTSFGTGSYATLQVVDKTAVDAAVNNLWVPGGKFVAVSNYRNMAAYSTDGINWTATTIPSASWRNVTYGNGKFVAINYSTDSMAAYSTDGINWTTATMPSSSDWCGVTYGNGKFVVVSGNSNKAAYSTNGINWTAATMPNNFWVAAAYGNGKFVAVGGNPNKAAYSTNGINWTMVTMPSGNWYDVVYGGY